MKEANSAPVYAACYPRLCRVCRRHGWGLAIHGTLGRDMDLVMVPWIDEPDHPLVVLRTMAEVMGWLLHEETWEAKPHGRVSYTMAARLYHGDPEKLAYIDVSVVLGPWAGEWRRMGRKREREAARQRERRSGVASAPQNSPKPAKKGLKSGKK